MAGGDWTLPQYEFGGATIIPNNKHFPLIEETAEEQDDNALILLYDCGLDGDKQLIGMADGYYAFNAEFDRAAFASGTTIYLCKKGEDGWNEQKNVFESADNPDIQTLLEFDDTGEYLYIYVIGRYGHKPGSLYRCTVETGDTKKIMDDVTCLLDKGKTAYMTTGDSLYRLTGDSVRKCEVYDSDLDDWLLSNFTGYAPLTETEGGVYLISPDKQISFLADSSDKPKELCTANGFLNAERSPIFFNMDFPPVSISVNEAMAKLHGEAQRVLALLDYENYLATPLDRLTWQYDWEIGAKKLAEGEGISDTQKAALEAYESAFMYVRIVLWVSEESLPENSNAREQARAMFENANGLYEKYLTAKG